MLIRQPLPFVQEFVAALDAGLRAHNGAGRELSRLQQRWLGVANCKHPRPGAQTTRFPAQITCQ